MSRTKSNSKTNSIRRSLVVFLVSYTRGGSFETFYCDFLPQTKFTKVMFLHVSVILSTRGRGVVRGACMAGGGMHGQGGVHGRGVCMVGKCMAGGTCVAGVVGACMAGGMDCRGHAWQGRACLADNMRYGQ